MPQPADDGGRDEQLYGGAMTDVPGDELIASAAAVLNPQVLGGRSSGTVACTLVTVAGNRYSGVCIDVPCSMGFCAEHAAIAAMVTAGEFKIAKIVAVWRDETGRLYVFSPCGRCREFMHQVHPENMDAEVLLGRGTSAKLRDLLPYSQRLLVS
jgi:cytidine deaminase